MRFARARLALALALVPCLSLGTLAFADGPPPFDSVTLSSPVPGAHAEGPGAVKTTVSVRADGSVQVELVAGSKVLATTNGKATADELSRLARELSSVKPSKADAGSAAYALSWRARGADGALSAAVPARERGDFAASGLVLALRAVSARLVWGDMARPLPAKARSIAGVVEVKGEDVFVRDAKLGAVLVKETNASGSLAWHLKKEGGRTTTLLGVLEKTPTGLALALEGAEGTVSGKPDLFLSTTELSWPHSVALDAGTPLVVRATVADADGNDYDWVEVAGGLQGYMLRGNVKVVAAAKKPATPGLAGQVPGH